MNSVQIEKNIRPKWLTVVSLMAILFGLATIKAGGTVIFTEQGRSNAGNYVAFILWFNFIAGFGYVVAGIMMLRLKSCAKRLSAILAVLSLLFFIALGLYILNGGAFETRTIAAMTLRSTFWIVIASILFKSKVLDPIDCKC